MTFVPSKDLAQPGHPPSLIRVFAVHSKDPSFLLVDSKNLSDWVVMQAVESSWAHISFCLFCLAAAQMNSYYGRRHCFLMTPLK